MTIPQGAIDTLRRRMKSQDVVTVACYDLSSLLDAAERCNRLEAVLRKIRDWDHLDNAADGPYWKREIDEALKEQP